MKRNRAALYLRVSTDEQSTENQRIALTGVAERRGWEIVRVYSDDAISGGLPVDARPGLRDMLRDARRRHFDILAVWSIDRLGRSTATVATVLQDLDAVGVCVYADQQGMDGTTAHGRAMLQMAAVFAELERAMIRERTRAGLDRARAAGRMLGAPRVSERVIAAIRHRLALGRGMLDIAKEVGVGTGTVQVVAKKMRAEIVAAAARGEEPPDYKLNPERKKRTPPGP